MIEEIDLETRHIGVVRVKQEPNTQNNTILFNIYYKCPMCNNEIKQSKYRFKYEKKFIECVKCYNKKLKIGLPNEIIKCVDVETVNNGTYRNMKQINNRAKKMWFIEWVCPTCNEIQVTQKQKFRNKVYKDCYTCYQKSENRLTTGKKAVKNRRSFDGKDNPNWRNKREEMVCKCGKIFIGLIYGSWNELARQKYCSKDCKHKYSVSTPRPYYYNGKMFRSSWEGLLANYFDIKGIEWEFENYHFKTPFGYYIPDFYIPKENKMIEVKGYFREVSKMKFEWFVKNYSDKYNIKLMMKEEFEDLGFYYHRKKLNLPLDCQNELAS